jgi:hypothetical protein
MVGKAMRAGFPRRRVNQNQQGPRIPRPESEDAMRRITLKVLESIDSRNDLFLIRGIEMTVESICIRIDQAYQIQFWEDVRLYGLKEAIVYLDNFVESKSNPLHFVEERNELGRMLQEATDLAVQVCV